MHIFEIFEKPLQIRLQADLQSLLLVGSAPQNSSLPQEFEESEAFKALAVYETVSWEKLYRLQGMRPPYRRNSHHLFPRSARVGVIRLINESMPP